jgi:hypothetical protein
MPSTAVAPFEVTKPAGVAVDDADACTAKVYPNRFDAGGTLTENVLTPDVKTFGNAPRLALV